MYIKRPPLTWDLAKQEIIIAITPIGTKVELNYDFALTVAFDNIESVGGQEAVPVFNTLATKVESILRATEAEATRLGIFK
jgi:hypothetical protein